LTAEQLQGMIEEQSGKCGICEREETLYIDHCHSTGKVRKLLCLQCNTGLGNFRDDKALLGKAIEYLT
jgi:hypothetical protein